MKLNISKCKELIIDFAKDKQEFSPLIINGVAVDRVSSFNLTTLLVNIYKYVQIHLKITNRQRRERD